MSRSSPLIIRLARFVAGEAAPKERVRGIFSARSSRAIQDSASVPSATDLPLPPGEVDVSPRASGEGASIQLDAAALDCFCHSERSEESRDLFGLKTIPQSLGRSMPGLRKSFRRAAGPRGGGVGG